MHTTAKESEPATTKQAVVNTLIELGVEYAFTLPGLGITWMLDEFYKTRDDLRVVLTRSEQTASIMAQVVGRLTGKPGVYMGQGPFASTTGAFGVLEGYFSGAPMLVLTDTSCYDGFGMHGVYQTMTGDYGAADVRNVFKTMTKATYYATEPHESIYAIQQAYKQASLPRQGPCAVVLKSTIIKRDYKPSSRVINYPSEGYQHTFLPKPDHQAVKRLAQTLASAKQPVLIVGNGMQNPKSRSLVAQLAEKFGVAVATSYNGKGIVDETADTSVGMLGTWGMRSANEAVRQADVLVVVGASLGPDYIRFREADFIKPEQQKIIQVDIDPRNTGWVYPVDISICADGADVLSLLLESDCGENKKAKRLQWITKLKQQFPVPNIQEKAKPGTVSFKEVVETLDKFLTAKDMLTLDAGSNRIWATASLFVRTPGQLVVPGGIGGMGWGAPAAAATKLVHPEKNVICLAGDGGFAMTMDVMATCVLENLPITVVVANNAGLGMVRDNLKDNRIAVDFSPTNFAQIAQGMGCEGVNVNSQEQLAQALIKARHGTRPTVIDVAVDPGSSHLEISDY